MKQRISLRAHNGDYVCAEQGSGDKVVANRPNLGPWEVFEVLDLGENRVALQGSDGRFVCAEDGGGREVVANRTEIGPWETFVLHDLGKSSIALETSGGNFVCAEDGGGREVVANRTEIGPWETFRRIVPPSSFQNTSAAPQEHWVQVARENLMQGTVIVALTHEGGARYAGSLRWRRYSVFPPWYTSGDHDNAKEDFVARFVCDPFCDFWMDLPLGVASHQVRTDAYGNYTINVCTFGSGESK